MRWSDDRASTRTGLLVSLLALTLLLAGCGAEDGGDAGDGGGDAVRPQPGVQLEITVWPEGREGTALGTTLFCDPPGGNHPSPEQACTILRANQDALEGLPPDTICTQIYGGPEEAEVTGTIDGAEVNATFSRQNGCEIDRWDRVAALFKVE